MSNPVEVSKNTYDSFEGEKWNALIELVSGAELEELSVVQRVSHLAWWYSSEVLNGGHEQYFSNKDYFDQSEVISALGTLCAICQSKVLREAFEYFAKAKKEMPNDYDEYIVWEQEYDFANKMRGFDQKFYDYRPEIETNLLENHLNLNESEFIKWVP